jgi:NAD(P)-dependent dehydrogenase (short-subunit alcohol dehydrogenase family)
VTACQQYSVVFKAYRHTPLTDAPDICLVVYCTYVCGASDDQIMHLNLLDFNSVRKFAHEFKQQWDRLDMLTENAGTIEPGVTKDGYSITFKTNYLVS